LCLRRRHRGVDIHGRFLRTRVEEFMFETRGQEARWPALKCIAVVLALAASSLWAQAGLEGALSRVDRTSPAGLAAPWCRTPAAADFDDDNRPDGAILLDYGWQPQTGFRAIELHFTDGGDSELPFESNRSGLAVSALDVNQDGAADLVLEQDLTHKFLPIWRNEGRGRLRNVRDKDFPSFSDAGNHWLEGPSQRSGFPASGLPPQRGSDLAITTGCMLAYRAFAAREPTPPFPSSAGSRAVGPASPRAPPLGHSFPAFFERRSPPQLRRSAVTFPRTAARDNDPTC